MAFSCLWIARRRKQTKTNKQNKKMSENKNENEKKSSMEEILPQQELDSVSPPTTTPSKDRSHHKDNTTVEKEKRSIALLDKNLTADMKSSTQIDLDSVRQKRLTLEYASEFLKGDMEIVMSAVKRHGFDLQFASETLKSNKAIIMTAVRQYGCALRHVSESLKGDREIVLAAVKQNGRALEYASETLKGNKEIIMAAVQQYGFALQHASETLRGDREIVLAAVKQNGGTLEYASGNLKGDKEIVMAAVKQYGSALQHTSETLRRDRELVLAAVKQNGWNALCYASELLKGDKNFVMNTVKQDGRTLYFASDYLWADKEVVLAAVQNNFDALKYANDALKQDHDCLIAAGIWDKSYPAVSIDSSIGIDGQQHFILSTRFSLGEDSDSIVTEFTRLLNKNQYIWDNNIKIFSPNAFCKSTCNPDWTSMSWPCWGTFESCEFADHLKTRKPHDSCCWQYSYRWHLEEAKKRNGIMIQVVDGVYSDDSSYKHELGDGQKIEKLMAEEIGIKVFQFYEPPLWYLELPNFQVRNVNILVSKIKSWYNGGCKDMTPCEVKFEEE